VIIRWIYLLAALDFINTRLSQILHAYHLYLCWWLPRIKRIHYLNFALESVLYIWELSKLRLTTLWVYLELMILLLLLLLGKVRYWIMPIVFRCLLDVFILALLILLLHTLIRLVCRWLRWLQGSLCHGWVHCRNSTLILGTWYLICMTSISHIHCLIIHWVSPTVRVRGTKNIKIAFFWIITSLVHPA
jgi:hypothetical protein